MAAISSSQPRNGVSASPPSSPTTPCTGWLGSMVSRSRRGEVGTDVLGSGMGIVRDGDREAAGEQPRSP